MGCIFAKQEQNGRRIFRVYNVNEGGEELNIGKLEVTDSDLVHFHRGKEIRWPLRCLRRYGWEGELFSFESGRRCQTGPGIYAFKCKHAERLFNTVQECIRLAGQMELGANQAFDSSVPSRPTSMIELNDISLRNGAIPVVNPHLSNDASQQNYVNQPDPVQPEPEHPQYINTKYTKPNRPPENNADLLLTFMHEYPQERVQGAGNTASPQVYAVLDFSSSGDENSCPDETRMENGNQSSGRGLEIDGDMYEGGAEDDADVFLPENPQNDYLNVGVGVEPGRPPPPRPSYRDPSVSEANYSNVPRSSDTMIYISVDTNGSTTAPQTFSVARDSPQNSGCPYSLIDREKTIALRESGLRSRDDCDEGVRKTRHNSTINDIVGP
ncbi:hypothetical protein FSP39_011338 [Pinctada imbricata]|uniref:IRS-type PTB domain-containing protein n=1 Tax=Pinctada imbricata TaxID=66713 RepID=A0AA89C364_PINIB|nr:hypothetical protein FSP39_011338 [Pinctada imbricata]